MNSSSAENLGASRQLLRHTVATLAYRGGKVLRGAPVEFAEFRVAETTRTPGQILAHLGDLLDWALSMADGSGKWHKSNPSTWDEGIQRFFTSLTAFDQYLASNKPLHCPVESLFQGHCGRFDPCWTNCDAEAAGECAHSWRKLLCSRNRCRSNRRQAGRSKTRVRLSLPLRL